MLAIPAVPSGVWKVGIFNYIFQIENLAMIKSAVYNIPIVGYHRQYDQ